MRAKGAVLAVPAMVGGLWYQAIRAAHAPLPDFDDLDPTGFYGGAPDGVIGGPIEVAAMGDSTLTGPGLDHARDVFVAQAVARSRAPIHLTRYAVGGSRVADVLMHQLPRVLDARPDVAVVSVGSNDVVHSTPLPQFERDLRAVIGALDRAGIETVLCGLIDMSLIPRVPAVLKPLLGARAVAYTRRQLRATHPAARAVHAAADRRVNEAFRARGEEFFAADRFHPNGWGHRCLADALTPHLEGAVQRVLACRRTPAAV